MKTDRIYPRLHDITKVKMYIITVAEGKGIESDPIREVRYVAIDNKNKVEIIGELY